MSRNEKALKMVEAANEEEFVSQLTLQQSAIHAFITSIMPGDSAVDDVLQRTNLVLWRKRAEFTPGTNFRAWAFSCASWQARAYFKEKKRKNWLLFDDELAGKIADHASTHFPSTPDATRSAMEECLAKIRPADRELLLEHYELGDSLAECAERVGRTAASLKVTFFRLRAALRRCIKDHLAIESIQS